jgi:hypothetical protein
LFALSVYVAHYTPVYSSLTNKAFTYCINYYIVLIVIVIVIKKYIVLIHTLLKVLLTDGSEFKI